MPVHELISLSCPPKRVRQTIRQTLCIFNWALLFVKFRYFLLYSVYACGSAEHTVWNPSDEHPYFVTKVVNHRPKSSERLKHYGFCFLPQGRKKRKMGTTGGVNNKIRIHDAFNRRECFIKRINILTG